MCRIESLNCRIVKSHYDFTSTNFILIRIERFYQLTILPMIRIDRLFLDRKIVIVDQNCDFNNHALWTLQHFPLYITRYQLASSISSVPLYLLHLINFSNSDKS